jgi:hypothetical protein
MRLLYGTWLALLAACGARPTPADTFLTRIAEHCGRAYAGRIVANEGGAPDDPMAGKALVMHVRACAPGRLEIPFHVGEDRSRTWILSRIARGLRLEHDHRHQDGSSDALSMYGGDTAAAGSATRQEFPVNEPSRELFARQDRQVSMTNVWAIEIEPGRRFVYELAREGRLFRVEFDLTRPVLAPPTPWGRR